MAQAIFYALNSLVLIAILGSVAFWVHRLVAKYRSADGLPSLVMLVDREKPKWTVGEFLLMFGLLIIAFSALNYVAVRQGWIQPPAAALDAGADDAADVSKNMLPMLANNTLAGVIAMAVTLLWLAVIPRCSLKHLGFVFRLGDVTLGIKAAFWFIPPVLLISLVASQLIPYEHPVLDTLATTKVPGMWVMLFVSTAMIVPMVEEFMFRVMLQGGLQRLADPRLSSADPMAAGSEATADARREVHAPGSWIGDAYQPPSTSLSNEESSVTGDVWRPQAYWPIVVTSLFFALMHLGQGAAPIPLFFLSMGLGYLYRQTGRITASLLVHMVLNGLTLAVEFSRISAGIEQGGF